MLSAKQQRFVDEYLVDCNATAAYKRAGYNSIGRAAESNASRLIGNDKVKQAIKDAQAKRAVKTETTQERIVKRLWVEAEREGDGANHSARIAALKLLGLHVGMFVEKTPLDAFIRSLPEPYRGQFIAALSGQVRPDGNSSSSPVVPTSPAH